MSAPYNRRQGNYPPSPTFASPYNRGRSRSPSRNIYSPNPNSNPNNAANVTSSSMNLRAPRTDSQLSASLSQAKQCVRDLLRTKNDPVKQRKYIQSLRKISESSMGKINVLEIGAGPAIVSALRNHGDSEGLTSEVFALIRSLSGNLYCLMKMGIGNELLAAMDRFQDSYMLQAHACSAIKVLASARYSNEELIKLGVAELIRRCFSRHKTKAEVIRAACGALWTLSFVDSSREILFNHGFAPRILGAMSMFPYDLKVQEYGCGCIWTFGHVYTMIRLGASTFLLNAMRQHTKSERVAEFSCAAIRFMANVRDNTEVLIEQNAAKAIVDTMLLHFSKPRIQENACLAIWALCSRDGYKNRLMQDGVGHVVVETLNKNMSNPAVVEASCGVLTNLATSSDIANVLMGWNAESGVIDGAAKHAENELVQSKAICALRNLLWWVERPIDPTVEDKVLHIVNGASARFPTNPLIMKKANEIRNKILELRNAV